MWQVRFQVAAYLTNYICSHDRESCARRHSQRKCVSSNCSFYVLCIYTINHMMLSEATALPYLGHHVSSHVNVFGGNTEQPRHHRVQPQGLPAGSANTTRHTYTLSCDCKVLNTACMCLQTGFCRQCTWQEGWLRRHDGWSCKQQHAWLDVCTSRSNAHTEQPRHHRVRPQ